MPMIGKDKLLIAFVWSPKTKTEREKSLKQQSIFILRTEMLKNELHNHVFLLK